jgi:tRNA A37 threonylcarbamoyladenosine dehydratase
MNTTTPSSAYLQRFSGIARLYGQTQLQQLASAHFAVIGLGGVGAWVAESLVRSGIGHITLIDMDEVCMTNTNRQLHALTSTIGQSKIKILADRLLDINPELKVNLVEDFIALDNIPTLIHPHYDMVIDSIDMAHTKSGLIAYCLARKISIVTVGSAGGKRDPRLVTHNDLARTESDPMFVKVRHDLYRTYKFARDRKRKFRVDAIFSPEPLVYPKPDGTVCPKKHSLSAGAKLDCTGGMGACTMVTGTFGFHAASRGIARYLMKTERLIDTS